MIRYFKIKKNTDFGKEIFTFKFMIRQGQFIQMKKKLFLLSLRKKR